MWNTDCVGRNMVKGNVSDPDRQKIHYITPVLLPSTTDFLLYTLCNICSQTHIRKLYVIALYKLL